MQPENGDTNPFSNHKKKQKTDPKRAKLAENGQKSIYKSVPQYNTLKNLHILEEISTDTYLRTWATESPGTGGTILGRSVDGVETEVGRRQEGVMKKKILSYQKKGVFL